MTAKRVTIGAKPTLVHRETEGGAAENVSGDAERSAASSIEEWLKQGDGGQGEETPADAASAPADAMPAPPPSTEAETDEPETVGGPAGSVHVPPHAATTPGGKPRMAPGGALAPWAGIAGGAVAGAAVAAAIAWLAPQFSAPSDPRIAPLAERVAASEGELRRFGERIGKVDNEVAQALDDQSATAERVAEQAGRIAALNEALAEAARHADPALDIASPLFAVALGQLRATFYSGRPFEAELVNVYAIAGASDPFAAYLTELLGPARTGVPNAAELHRVFPSYVAAAGLRIGDPSGYQYGLSLVNRYVGISTETHSAEMANLAATRAGAALAAGDVAGAMSALRDIDPQSSDVMAPWLDAARDYLRAETAITEMTRVVVERLRDRAKEMPAGPTGDVAPDAPATLAPADAPAATDPATDSVAPAGELAPTAP